MTVTFSQSTYNVPENNGFANIVVQIVSGTVEKDIIVRYGWKICSNFFMIIFMWIINYIIFKKNAWSANKLYSV